MDMIKFFRGIRHQLLSLGNTGQYIKYAIGEIVLVVLGILIALQINNWNEYRKAINKEQALIYNLVTDLDADKERFAGNREEINDILDVYRQLYEVGVKETESHDIVNPNYVRRIVNIDPNLNKDFSTLSDNITNVDIRESLLSYDIKLKVFGVGFMEFRKVVEDRIRIFLGEKGLYKLESLYDNGPPGESIFIDVDGLIELAKENQFQQLLFEAKLKLEDLKLRLDDLLMENEALKNTIDKNMAYYQ